MKHHALTLLACLYYTTLAHAENMRTSWYHEGCCVAWHGAKFHPDGLTAAHRTLPFGTKLRVTYQGRSVEVIVTDRGPAKWTHRELDLSRGAARKIGMLEIGVANVSVDHLN